MPCRLPHLLGFALLLLPVTSFSQTPRWFHKQGGRISGVFFLNDTRGWTVEDGARTRRTLDGGITWQYGETPPAFREELTDVFFVTPDDGWAVSTSGSVLRSADGGSSWDKINTGPAVILDELNHPAYLNTVFMFDDLLTGWIGGDDGTLYRTFDGGINWSEANLPPGFTVAGSNSGDPEDAYKIRFWDSMKGYMVADYYDAYSTNNGGTSWNEIDLHDLATPCGADHNLELWDFDFGDSLTHGLMVGGVGVQEGYLFQTTDGGQSWSKASCLAFVPGSGDCNPPTTYGVAQLGSWPTAVAAGYDSMLLVNEVGTTALFDECGCTAPPPGSCAAAWNRLDAPDDFSPPYFALARIGTTDRFCATGLFGVIRILDTAPSYTITDKGTVDHIRLEGGDFISNTTGCVVGQAYTILRTENSGQDWLQVLPTLPAQPDVSDGWARDLDFSSSGVKGVAVGDAGFTAWSNDAGLSWTPVFDGTVNFRCVAFLPESSTVFAGGVGGVLRRSLDGGVTWETTPQPGTIKTITSMAFVDVQNGYLVGEGEVAFRTTNGGGSWLPVETVDNDLVTDFLGVATWGDGTQAMAVGSDGRVYEKTGARFVKVNLTAQGIDVTNVFLTDVEAFASGPDLSIRICGTGGVMLFRDNGTWSLPKSQTSEEIMALSFRSKDVGYGIGQPFLITKYE